jgi:threonine synthase
MGFVGYDCDGCQSQFAPEAASYRCPSCGANLSVRVDATRVRRDVISASRDLSMWRYAPLLAVAAPDANTGPLTSVGGTPLFEARRMAQRMGLDTLWIKDEGRMPTGSLKDRASAVVTLRAREIGAERVITASTGNAGVALSAMAAAAGVDAVILVPASAPPAKIAQLKIFGANLMLVRGSYDAAFELAEAAATEFGWYCRNTGSNPFTAEGKKTVAFEIAEQLGWRAPDRVVVPVGDGNILVGVATGFRQLHALGFIDREPMLLGVQAEGSSPIARAFLSGGEQIESVETNTLADSIAAGRPADGLRALRAVRASGGSFVTVSDEQILESIALLGRCASVFAEPAAAAGHAGLAVALAQGSVQSDEEVVLLITGSGLKDIAAAERAAHGDAPVIDASLDSLRDALSRQPGNGST